MGAGSSASTISTPKGYCLQPEFVRGVQTLGKLGINFDLCMRPGDLLDALALTEKCPDTRFVLDHCGNADINAFVPGAKEQSHDPEAWKRDIKALAKRPNVFSKISGIIAKAKPGWTAQTLAPVVNHCLDSFGPDRRSSRCAPPPTGKNSGRGMRRRSTGCRGISSCRERR